MNRSMRASETSLQRQVEDLSAELVEEHHRAELAEGEVVVLERALLRLLQTNGSAVADRRELRQFLGLRVREGRPAAEAPKSAVV